MKRFVFAGALVALAAPFTVAEETPPAGTAAPVVVTGTPVVESATVVTTAAPARRGLFGRLRNRGTTTYAAPATGTTVVTPGTVITPAPTTTTPAPAPMPMPKPDTKTDTAAAPGGIVLASGTATETGVTSAVATETTKQRRGLFGRLRNR